MLQRSQKKRAELAFVPVGHVEVIARQQPSEKFLGQILAVVRAVTFSAQVSIKGIPIRPAQLVHRVGSLGRAVASSFGKNTPVGRRKETPSVRVTSTRALRS